MLLPRVYTKNGIQAIRERRQREGSHPFSVTISDILASGEAVYGFDSNSAIRKFLPMNFFRIQNKGGTTLKIYIGQKTEGEVVLDDTIWTYYGNFYSFKIENLGASTATGATIYTTVQKKAGG